MGAHVLKVAHVHRIHLYDVPELGSEGSRQKREAQDTTDAGGDHHRTKGDHHPVRTEDKFTCNGDGFGRGDAADQVFQPIQPLMKEPTVCSSVSDHR